MVSECYGYARFFNAFNRPMNIVSANAKTVIVAPCLLFLPSGEVGRQSDQPTKRVLLFLCELDASISGKRLHARGKCGEMSTLYDLDAR